MARTAVTNQETSRAGITIATGVFESGGDPVNGHVFNNSDGLLVLVKNTSADTDYWVRFLIGATIDGQTVSPKEVDVPFGKEMIFGPFPKSVYGQASPDQDKLYVDVESASIKLYGITPGN